MNQINEVDYGRNSCQFLNIVLNIINTNQIDFAKIIIFLHQQYYITTNIIEYSPLQMSQSSFMHTRGSEIFCIKSNNSIEFNSFVLERKSSTDGEQLKETALT